MDGDTTEVRGEPRAPVLGVALVAIVLPLFMPDGYMPGRLAILPVVQLVLLAAIAITDPGRIDRRSIGVRRLRLALIVALVLGAAWATGSLVDDLVDGAAATNEAGELLLAGGLVWTYLVIAFAFLYWELDSGGPGQRAHERAPHPDIAFPQQLNPDIAPPGWRPVFFDYLFLGLTGALAFSPTDAMPLARWSKLAMGVEAVTSLMILGLVIARAVNVFS